MDVVETTASNLTWLNGGPALHDQLSLWQEEIDWRRCKTLLIGDNGYFIGQ
jgi:hypothetical protein